MTIIIAILFFFFNVILESRKYVYSTAGLAPAMGVKTALYLEFMLINIERQHVYECFLFFPLGMEERGGTGGKTLTAFLAPKIKEKIPLQSV